LDNDTNIQHLKPATSDDKELNTALLLHKTVIATAHKAMNTNSLNPSNTPAIKYNDLFLSYREVALDLDVAER